MKTYSNIALFKYLCLDLGVTYVHNELNLEELGRLKDTFLELAEKGFPNDNTEKWLEEYKRSFQMDRCITASGLRNYPNAFQVVYQSLCWALKIRRPITEQQEEAYIEKFLNTESATKAWKVDRGNPVSRLARWLCRRTFANLNLDARAIQKHGRHGPGATFEGAAGSDKNTFCRSSEQLERYAPYDLFFLNEDVWCDSVKRGCRIVRSADSIRKCRVSMQNAKTHRELIKAHDDMLRELRREPVAYSVQYEDSDSRSRFNESRLTLVPKTYKGPRGVFISSKEAMFWQLAQGEAIIEYSRNTWIANCYNPRDQLPSGQLAYEGSYSRWCSTLDLTDASDRIPLSLVAFLFHRKDYLALASTRPCYVWLPNGERHKLGMFSPMGDGKTFPILTIICAIVTLSAILISQGEVAARPPSIERVESVSRSIRIFGDDIIVPSQYFSDVVAALEAHNLRVNVRKSFTYGHFREACGTDAFNGVDVTPLRQKGDLDNLPRIDIRDTEHVTILLGLIALHNHCMIRGYVKTAYYICDYISHACRQKVGITTDIRSNPFCLFVGWPARPTASRRCQRECWHRTADDVCYAKAAPDGDVLQCVWCGSNGLIARLDSLRIPWRYDALHQRIVQRVLAPSPIKYEDSLDPWWDANYRIMHMGDDSLQKTVTDDPSLAKRVIQGSPMASKLLERHARAALPYERSSSPGGGLRLQWVSVC